MPDSPGERGSACRRIAIRDAGRLRPHSGHEKRLSGFETARPSTGKQWRTASLRACLQAKGIEMNLVETSAIGGACARAALPFSKPTISVCRDPGGNTSRLIRWLTYCLAMLLWFPFATLPTFAQNTPPTISGPNTPIQMLEDTPANVTATVGDAETPS